MAKEHPEINFIGIEAYSSVMVRAIQKLDNMDSIPNLKLINKYGPNEIKQTKPKKWYNYLLESLFSPFNSILLRNCCNFILHRCLFT